jgi:DNA helicase HerA-like ATPase
VEQPDHDIRRELEAAVAPQARSLDGRSFEFQAPVDEPVQPGSYVTIAAGGRPALGPVVESRLDLREGPEVETTGTLGTYRTRVAFHVVAGRGVVLEEAPPFHDAALRTAEPAEVSAYLDRTAPRRARLEIGRLAFAADVPARLDAGGFGRHTFLCGQSGSGKSYALSVMLEQLLLGTDLRIVILDPNSDFARLPETREGADPDRAERWAERATRMEVRRAGGTGQGRLHMRFFDLGARSRAAVAELDPLRDRDEYAALLSVIDREAAGATVAELLQSIRNPAPEEAALSLRIRNLGLLDWSIWSLDNPESGLLERLRADDWRALVVDLGSVQQERERAAVAEAVLAELWALRDRRRPTLCVIDEAHNVCPASSSEPLTVLSTEHAVRIAGEGRKFGLHLLVSTQRPSKVHDNVLSQCDNLVLMRMNSAADIAHLTGLFAYAPASLIERSTVFRQGEALVAGGIVGHPTFVRVGGRITQEGGSDVPADWAADRGDRAPTG